MSVILKLTPDQPLAESSLQVHVQNLIAALAESLSDIADEAADDWSKQTGVQDNKYMHDNLSQLLLSTALGFLQNSRAHQLTPVHVEDYFAASTTPPAAKDPEPLED
jgi:hypothetical protein